ncbi:MAG: hypothetical protein ABFR33_07380 [Verrucomicrobiota bacterium]
MKYQSSFNPAKTICFWLIFSFVNVGVFNAHAETVYYSLDNVILDDGTQMAGLFSWIYDIGDFENGVGQFVSLEIPWTTHDESDLSAIIDVTESIEIVLTNNVHDDGVDIMLVLEQPLTPNTSSLINTNNTASKYEIGGNGFHTGIFLSGSIVPTNATLSIAADSPGFASLSWGPDIPGLVLQETSNLSSNWMDSASGSTNPIVVPATAPTMFYRLAKP